jgi:hypothetical protein
MPRHIQRHLRGCRADSHIAPRLVASSSPEPCLSFRWERNWLCRSPKWQA